MTPTLSPRTALFGLLGHPVAHSLSPSMHNAAFAALGIDAVYLAFDVEPGRLAEALTGSRALGVAGWNVTVPHKEAALALAAEADPRAELVGAANTLVPVRAGWRAHNTDVAGFARALAEDLAFHPEGRRCWIWGAGGAARAAVVALALGGAQEIRVMNRNAIRARLLADELGSRLGPTRVAAEDLAAFAPRPGDLVVSATPAGLSDDASWPWDLGSCRELFVYDMAYRRGAETPLVVQARALGHRAASGRSMLLHQGAEAFRLWTGREPPLDAMARAMEPSGPEPGDSFR
ncbi:shikimate dehydrogenase [Deferrisoma camini]|uniref:shikimate dehydrogenase n=1 Tax=Deferrisoma camini TaxID=1035120 RepID=UPI00046CFC45|nr:shikimate dehydrogenase [Deferrisoma camini]